MIEEKPLNLRKLVSFALLASVLAVAAAVSVVFLANEDTPTEASVFVSPQTLNVTANQFFQVNVSISSATNLYAWEFKISYNTSLLGIISITEGDFLNSSRDTYLVPEATSPDGHVLEGCTSLTNVAGVSGNGTLATVEFIAKTAGSCSLVLYDTKLVDSGLQLMPHNETGGTVQVAPAGPTPIASGGTRKYVC